MIEPARVIRLTESLMDVLLADWEAGYTWGLPSPLPGLMPGHLRPAEEVEPVLEELLATTGPEVVAELERWWRAVDHYHPLVAKEYGGCIAELMELLGEEDRKKQENLVLKDEIFQSWGLAVRLLEESQEQRFEDPHKATDLAQLAVLVAQLLDPDHYEPRWVADLEALCWAHVGNGRRILGEMRCAAEAFDAAGGLLRMGTGRGLPKARVESLEASLLTETGDLGRAEELLCQVVSFYGRAGQSHEEGRSRIKLSKVVYERGGAAEAVQILQRAVCGIDLSKEPQLSYIAKKNLAACLLELGEADEADKVMSGIEAPGSFILTLHGILLRAQIWEVQGRFEEAEKALNQLRQIYLQRGLGYDAALVSMDLASVYLKQGKSTKVKELAAEIYPLFMAQGVELEALAVLLVLRRAAEEDVVTLELVKGLSKVLKKIRK